MTVAKSLGICACTVLAPLTSFAAVASAAVDKDFNGYQCDAVTVRYVGTDDVTLPFSGDLRDFNEKPGTKTIKVYNALATGCDAIGHAPEKGASKNRIIKSDDVESPAEGTTRTYTGKFLVGCLKMDAGDGTGTVTGSHCHVIQSSGEPLV
ncbi:hypothetical protein [Nocardia pseudobrasiliensis]|uniref:Uncharacterized protein n=1 Tax=Nocardia pseudobrasiliensis TaxID=45979 RepID=A0A370IG21_9NOCA|nr:hypothetical protein [Nocardia pseudobrasiliensis]RDI68404.1 hypothetical protein DFR76_102805 [Nocardia pseudobrasiliensis]